MEEIPNFLFSGICRQVLHHHREVAGTVDLFVDRVRRLDLLEVVQQGYHCQEQRRPQVDVRQIVIRGLVVLVNNAQLVDKGEVAAVGNAAVDIHLKRSTLVAQVVSDQRVDPVEAAQTGQVDHAEGQKLKKKRNATP